jgi:hypothetical protein
MPRLWLNVRLREDPMPQATFVLGDVTVTEGASILKLALVALVAGLAVHWTRTRAVVVAGPGTTQA